MSSLPGQTLALQASTIQHQVALFVAHADYGDSKTSIALARIPEIPSSLQLLENRNGSPRDGQLLWQ